MSRGYAIVGLCNPKDGANIGSVLRAAQCFGACSVAIQGKRYKKIRFPTDTMHAWAHLPVFQTDDLFSFKPDDAEPVVVEYLVEARNLVRFKHPERAFYIFGPEDGSVPVEIRERCLKHIMVPTLFCLNLAAVVNIVLYDRLAKTQGD